jgi:hypothetical protein
MMKQMVAACMAAQAGEERKKKGRNEVGATIKYCAKAIEDDEDDKSV